ncbi:Pentatricopeptide repeat-containing protein [Musa troglodytarum]|uniref:Pentatricopeptide repeat-containing protein n=1 Tax=Musa troglodytarum TaxID=320322 RepID=A0A9E7I702_9LILI|nr:Pentatricopeptide repeat-containing protein [Musa troglodytarum]
MAPFVPDDFNTAPLCPGTSRGCSVSELHHCSPRFMPLPPNPSQPHPPLSSGRTTSPLSHGSTPTKQPTTLRPLTSSSRAQPPLRASNARFPSLGLLLPACSSPSDLATLPLLPSHIHRLKLEYHAPVAAAPLDACHRCGAHRSAHQLFDRMAHEGVVWWTVLVSSCSKSGRFHKALSYFRLMMEQGIAPDEAALVRILSAAVRSGQLRLKTT